MKKALASLVAFCLCLTTLSDVAAADATARNSKSVSVTDDASDKVTAAVESLVLLKKDLNDRYTVYLNSTGAVAQAEADLEPVQLTINSLKDQLATLDENIKRTQEKSDLLRADIVETEHSLADLLELSEARQLALARAKKLLADFVQMAYAGQRRYTGTGETVVSTAKFLLAGDTLAESDLSQTYLAVLQSTLQKLIDDVSIAEAEYQTIRGETLVKRGQLITMSEDLDESLRRLADMRAAKDALLEETKGKEKNYLKLIEEAQKEQASTLKDIESLKDNMSAINEKLGDLKKKIGDEEFQKLLAEKGASVEAKKLNLVTHAPRLLWPADPSRGITAYFHDSEYAAMFGVTHQAIDFRVSQGTSIGSSAPGFVYKTHNGGLGYSYVMLVHPGGLMTAYGHISQILVREGDFVQVGETIGLSGGTPGTHGAGWMTTGPHLHFEVFSNGEHVDPLDYLPLESLPEKDIPAKYFEK